MNNNKKVVNKVVNKNDVEKQNILANADKIKGEQLFIADDGNIGLRKEFEAFFADGKSIENPEKKYDIYYKGIEKLLRKHLPKGKQFAAARGYIREEKCVYLTRGKRKNEDGIRLADSRMGYVSDAEEMLKVITNWILDNGTMVELHNKIRDLNISKGYGKRVHY